jgi:hypothetical protein
MTETEVSMLTIPLLEMCDRTGRQHIAMLAMAAWMETYSPEQRQSELTRAFDGFCTMLDTMRSVPPRGGR